MTVPNPSEPGPGRPVDISVRWHREFPLSATELTVLLETFGDLLPTPLSARMDLTAYAAKLLRHAEVAQARVESSTVGLLAIYANDLVTKRGHIPIVAVLPSHRGLGVARKLLHSAMDMAALRGMETIDLEVALDNARAQSVYAAVGFSSVPSTGGMLRMECRL